MNSNTLSLYDPVVPKLGVHPRERITCARGRLLLMHPELVPDT